MEDWLGIKNLTNVVFLKRGESYVVLSEIR